MYRAIIVDDEELVRQGLRKHFDWAGHGVEIMADLPDGREALNFLSTHSVDLIVTDVRMPDVDGIELAIEARKLLPRVKVLFVSGHADVRYLKEALKMDAVDYILKSVDLDELSETVARVTRIMDEERERDRALQQMEEKLTQSMPLLQERILASLVLDDLESDEPILNQLEFLEIPIDDSTRYCLLVIQLKDLFLPLHPVSQRDRTLRSLKIQAECAEEGARCGPCVCFRSRTGEFVLVLPMEQEEYETTLLEVSEALERRLIENVDLRVSIGISDRFSGLLNFHPAYKAAVNAIRNRYLLDEKSLISIDKYEGADLARRARAQAERALREAFSQGSAEKLGAMLLESIGQVDGRLSQSEMQNHLIYLLMLPATLDIDPEIRARSEYRDFPRILERYMRCRDQREQLALIQQLYEEAASLGGARLGAHAASIIQRVREIINTQYMDQLSLQNLAEQVNLTPTYLCVLFKQLVGKTINEYLTETRIEHAKQLLADPRIRLYDVCYRAGYLSPSYFSKLFKKHTGVVPSEYRDLLLSADGTPREDHP